MGRHGCAGRGRVSVSLGRGPCGHRLCLGQSLTDRADSDCGVRRQDRNLQRGVAVDDVIARIAHEEVAPPTAEQDVSTVPAELRLSRHRVRREHAPLGERHEFIQPFDQVEVNELIARVAARQGVRPAQDVGKRRAAHPLDAVVAVRDRVVRRRQLGPQEDRETEVDVHPEAIVRKTHPVEAELTFSTIDSRPVDDDVVAALHVEVVVTTVRDGDIVALRGRFSGLSRNAVIRLEEVFTTPEVLYPVVAATASDVPKVDPIEDVVVPFTGEDLAKLARVDDEVIAGVAEDDIFLVAARDCVVAVAALDHIGSGEVRDDVIAGPALDEVGAIAALDSVIAGATPEGVVADATDDRIAARRPSDGDVVATRVLDDAGRVQNADVRRESRVIADHERNQLRLAHRVGRPGVAVGRKLLALIGLQNVIRNRKEVQ